MFTGIITHKGQISTKTDSELRITAPADLCARLTTGTSIAVDGICLTVTSHDTSSFGVTVMPETVRKTNLNSLNINSAVNLELPGTPTSFLAGHIVQGHIDTTARIESITPEGNSLILSISLTPEFARYVVPKGSIAINGISLTVISATNTHFTVGIIPHTQAQTTLGAAKVADMVNIEFDIIAKYLERIHQ